MKKFNVILILTSLSNLPAMSSDPSNIEELLTQQINSTQTVQTCDPKQAYNGDPGHVHTVQNGRSGLEGKPGIPKSQIYYRLEELAQDAKVGSRKYGIDHNLFLSDGIHLILFHCFYGTEAAAEHHASAQVLSFSHPTPVEDKSLD